MPVERPAPPHGAGDPSAAIARSEGVRVRRWRLFLGLVIAVAAAFAWLERAPGGDRSGRDFDPDRLADLEVAMWKAYYKKEKLALFLLLLDTLREQYRYSREKALRVGFRFARAAAVFGDARDQYERVLPDLEAGYAVVRDWSGRGFDPKAVARAELAWWAARRDPATASPETVGGLIADEYALQYELPRAKVLDAAVLRARAGRLRDDGGEHADWDTVSGLLHESYRSLHAALASP